MNDYADEGVPTLTTLVEDFPDVAREALADAQELLGGAGGAAEGGGAAPAPEEEPEAGAVRPHSGTEGQHGDGDSGYSSEESVDLYERHSVTAMGQRHDPV